MPALGSMHACMQHHAWKKLIALPHPGAGIHNADDIRRPAHQAALATSLPSGKPSKASAAAPGPATAAPSAADAVPAASVTTMHRFLRKVHSGYRHVLSCQTARVVHCWLQ